MMSHNTKRRKWNAIDFYASIEVHCTTRTIPFRSTYIQKTFCHSRVDLFLSISGSVTIGFILMGVSAVSGAVVPADTSTGLSTGPRHVFGAGNPAQVTTTNNPTESIARHLIQGSVQWIRRLVIKPLA